MLSNSGIEEMMNAAREMVEPMETPKPTEKLLQFLRHKSDSKIVSIMIVSKLFDMSIPIAKEVVHSSQTWSDRFEGDEALHDEIEKSSAEL